MDVVGKQSAWGDGNRRDITINKTGLKWGHTKHMHGNRKNAFGMGLWGKLPDLGNQHSWVPLCNACMLLHAAQVTNRRNYKPACTHRAMTSLGPQGRGRIAHGAAVLCWMDTGSLARTDQEGKVGKLPCV